MRRLETEIVKDLFEKQFRDILRNFEFPKNVKKSTCCFTKVIDDGNRTNRMVSGVQLGLLSYRD